MTARISVSSWTLHRALGAMWLDGFDPVKQTPPGPTREIDLLELPGKAAAHGIRTLELCHFHFSSRDNGYLAELATEADAHDVELYSILIDDGDITAPDPAIRARDTAWIRGWIDTASQLGAGAARVIAGDTDPVKANGSLTEDPNIRQSAAALQELHAYGAERGVKVFTENFKKLSLKADQLLAILELCDGQITICADFGNFKGEDRYEEFAKIAPHATSAHAKAQYTDEGAIIPDDLIGGMRVLNEHDFQGPFSLIFDQPMADGKTEWDYLDLMKGIADQHIRA